MVTRETVRKEHWEGILLRELPHRFCGPLLPLALCSSSSLVFTPACSNSYLYRPNFSLQRFSLRGHASKGQTPTRRKMDGSSKAELCAGCERTCLQGMADGQMARGYAGCTHVMYSSWDCSTRRLTDLATGHSSLTGVISSSMRCHNSCFFPEQRKPHSCGQDTLQRFWRHKMRPVALLGFAAHTACAPAAAPRLSPSASL